MKVASRKIRVKRQTAVGPRARTKILPSLYSRAHIGFCKRCRPIARVAISCLFLRFVLIFKSNVLQNMNALISKKCAYFRLPCLFSRV